MLSGDLISIMARALAPHRAFFVRPMFYTGGEVPIGETQGGARLLNVATHIYPALKLITPEAEHDALVVEVVRALAPERHVDSAFVAQGMVAELERCKTVQHVFNSGFWELTMQLFSPHIKLEGTMTQQPFDMLRWICECSRLDCYYTGAGASCLCDMLRRLLKDWERYPIEYAKQHERINLVIQALNAQDDKPTMVFAPLIAISERYPVCDIADSVLRVATQRRAHAYPVAMKGVTMFLKYLVSIRPSTAEDIMCQLFDNNKMTAQSLEMFMVLYLMLTKKKHSFDTGKLSKIRFPPVSGPLIEGTLGHTFITHLTELCRQDHTYRPTNDALIQLVGASYHATHVLRVAPCLITYTNKKC